MSMDSLSNFFEKQLTQHHSQDLLGLSRALFPTTFLEVAVYVIKDSVHSSFLWKPKFRFTGKKTSFLWKPKFWWRGKKVRCFRKKYILQRNKQELNELRQTVLLK